MSVSQDLAKIAHAVRASSLTVLFPVLDLTEPYAFLDRSPSSVSSYKSHHMLSSALSSSFSVSECEFSLSLLGNLRSPVLITLPSHRPKKFPQIEQQIEPLRWSSFSFFSNAPINDWRILFALLIVTSIGITVRYYFLSGKCLPAAADV